MRYKLKKFCRCCKSKDLILYLDLENQPLANSYHKGDNLSKIPLQVMLCKNCFHNQLSVVVNPDLMFRNYLYVSGTTLTFRNHTKSLAKDCVRRFKRKRLNVLDIACNDGTQLEYFRQLGCEVSGVDPAKNLRKITRKKKIPVVVDYWNNKTAKKMNNKFDIITGTNVFAHVDDVNEFLEASKIVLSKSGLLILEFPYANKMINHNEFDTVYHEHLSYFLVNSFKILIERLEFHIVDVIQTDIHGGSIRFFLQKGKGPHSVKVSRLIDNEKQKGLFRVSTYQNYAKQVAKNKKDMKDLLLKLRKKKKKVIGYGASAKGNTMLNYFKINLSYTVDDNPLKWGYMTPGRNIPIRNPDYLKKEEEDLYVVILAWNFYTEIAKRIRKIRPNNKDFAIFYVPNIKQISISSSKKYKESA